MNSISNESKISKSKFLDYKLQGFGYIKNAIDNESKGVGIIKLMKEKKKKILFFMHGALIKNIKRETLNLF